MAKIKLIEGKSIHQIQSGQVIVDLCSVVKELVENSLDAGATSIDVRFKCQGLETIEVQDNGRGISSDDYQSLALKHYTSKLSSYEDLDSLDTFGFRGEALSSLCALSKLHVLTAQDGEAPKGTRLDFEQSGKLKSTCVAACQKGTIVVVEDLFFNLPVRKRELEKNIKREYGKVLALLQAYACISIGVRFVVSNQATKGKKAVVFQTKSNDTTRENIANVYGAKTLTALVALDLNFELQPTSHHSQLLKKTGDDGDAASSKVYIQGHISRPIFGEGRQMPDRQMFFVNGRPCGLPQISKAFNEVYKSYNLSQSPFIFANFKMDTNAYDVNVSPDKRTILLHDQTELIESLKRSLAELFDSQEQTMPQSQAVGSSIQASAPRYVHPAFTIPDPGHDEREDLDNFIAPMKSPERLQLVLSESVADPSAQEPQAQTRSFIDSSLPDNGVTFQQARRDNGPNYSPSNGHTRSSSDGPGLGSLSFVQGTQYNRSSPHSTQGEIPSLQSTPQRQQPGAVQAAYDRMRPRRVAPEVATITIGDKTSTAIIGPGSWKRQRLENSSEAETSPRRSRPKTFSRSLRAFAAAGSQISFVAEDSVSEDDHESDILTAASTRRSSSSGEQQFQHATHPTVRDDDYNSGSQDESESVGTNEYSRRVEEEARVQGIVREVEAAASLSAEATMKRASNALKGGLSKHSTLNLAKVVKISARDIETFMEVSDGLLGTTEQMEGNQSFEIDDLTGTGSQAAEARLSLTISKDDFAEMQVIGQFNLGFILATRSSRSTKQRSSSKLTTPSDLFIIDQHASDEIFNFSRLSLTTTLTPQRLAQPLQLHLTAVEEEIIEAHNQTLVQNGFVLSFDTTGNSPVGQRCKLLALPTSKDTTFNPRDLEELIALLSDAPAPPSNATDISTNTLPVVRPSKVRRMLAMRACRSSIMVGRELTGAQMTRVVRNMGEIERPWNCPHGRPTMRHLAGLEGWKGWTEDAARLYSKDTEDMLPYMRQGRVDWRAYVIGNGNESNGEDAA